MNFLGHLFLSGDEPLVITGNFMADAVKGRDLSRFHPDIQRGIRLHRAIDSFTDQHPAHRTGRQRVRTHAGRYAPVVMDLFYDHLLASRWSEHHPEPLTGYAQRMYALLFAQFDRLPADTARMLPYMAQGDWLTSYATIEGIGRALGGLARRVPEGSPMIGAERVLAEHIDHYRAEFDIFLPELQNHLIAFR